MRNSFLSVLLWWVHLNLDCEAVAQTTLLFPLPSRLRNVLFLLLSLSLRAVSQVLLGCSSCPLARSLVLRRRINHRASRPATGADARFCPWRCKRQTDVRPADRPKLALRCQHVLGLQVRIPHEHAPNRLFSHQCVRSVRNANIAL